MTYSFNGRPVIPKCEILHDLIPYFGGISMRDYFMDAPSCAEAYRVTERKVNETFDGILPMIPLVCPPLSYGHIACIGGEVDIPETEFTEPYVKSYIGSMDEGIALLKRNWNFEESKWFRHYVSMTEYLRIQFPDRIVPFTFGVEGPVTTAVLMRGQDFYMDIYDEPEKCKEFLRLVTQSIIQFHHLLSRMNGKPEVDPQEAGLCDDFAALIPPNLWNDFVIPYWNMYYEGLTTGTRFVHVEGCSPNHLKYLASAKIDHYQPSVSKMLTIENIKANTNVKFDLLLYVFYITNMNDDEISAWVDNAVSEGIEIIRTQLSKYTFKIGKEDRIKAFFRAFEKYRNQ